MVVGPVHRGADVARHHDAIVAVERVEAGAQHAVVGVDAADHQRLDVEIAQQQLEVGVVERAVAMLEHRVLARARRRAARRSRSPARLRSRASCAACSRPGTTRAVLRHPERALVVDGLAARGIVAVMRAHEDHRPAGGSPRVAQAHRARDDAVGVRLRHQQMPDRMIEMRAVHVDDQQRAAREPRRDRSRFAALMPSPGRARG